jgi:TRAP-type uncharacterized transport system fused permease subunit
LLIGEPVEIAIAVCTAMFGVWLISCATVGYFMRALTPVGRILFVVAGAGALVPASAFPGGAVVDVIGVVAGIAIMVYEYLAVTRLRAPASGTRA